MVIVTAIFLFTVILIIVDYLLDDRNANLHVPLHNAVYILVGIWCLYWSISLANDITTIPQSQRLSAFGMALAEMGCALIPVIVLRMTVWKEQALGLNFYGSDLGKQLSIGSEVKTLHSQATALAKRLGMNESGVPTLLSDYGGYIQELQMRFQANTRIRTNKSILALMEQVIAGYDVVRRLHLAEEALKGIQG
jgi:hypothetical protein